MTRLQTLQKLQSRAVKRVFWVTPAMLLMCLSIPTVSKLFEAKLLLSCTDRSMISYLSSYPNGLSKKLDSEYQETKNYRI